MTPGPISLQPMTWLSAALPYVGGGVLGAAVTYGLTWLRERRRTLDAYRAPQRQAIGEIVAATHELMLRELELRTAQTELISHIRRPAIPTAEMAAELRAAATALGSATLTTERAFQIGRLTIVDAPCWEAMGAAYIALTKLRQTMAAKGESPNMKGVEEVEDYVATIQALARQLNESVLALVITSVDRVSPVESMVNRRRRRVARSRLGKRFGSAVDTVQAVDARREP